MTVLEQLDRIMNGRTSTILECVDKIIREESEAPVEIEVQTTDEEGNLQALLNFIKSAVGKVTIKAVDTTEDGQADEQDFELSGVKISNIEVETVEDHESEETGEYKSEGEDEPLKESKNWSGGAHENWHPKEGFFEQSAEKIAKGLKAASDDQKQASSRLNFYINRAGKNLSDEDKSKLKHAKDILKELY